jgi:hypothetical protein
MLNSLPLMGRRREASAQESFYGMCVHGESDSDGFFATPMVKPLAAQNDSKTGKNPCP